MKEKIYTISQVSEIIGKQQATIYTWINLGKVHTVKKRFGKQKMITESELKRIQNEMSDFIESEG